MDLFTKRRSFRGGFIRLGKSLQRLALGCGWFSSLGGVPATITCVIWFNIVWDRLYGSSFRCVPVDRREAAPAKISSRWRRRLISVTRVSSFAEAWTRASFSHAKCNVWFGWLCLLSGFVCRLSLWASSCVSLVSLFWVFCNFWVLFNKIYLVKKKSSFRTFWETGLFWFKY